MRSYGWATTVMESAIEITHGQCDAVDVLANHLQAHDGIRCPCISAALQDQHNRFAVHFARSQFPGNPRALAQAKSEPPLTPSNPPTRGEANCRPGDGKNRVPLEFR
jgi:hypothetical protein